MSRLRDSGGMSEETSPWGYDPGVQSRWLRLLGQIVICWWRKKSRQAVGLGSAGKD